MIQNFDAKFILAIPLSWPEKLFGSPGEMREHYRALMKRWHPDLAHEPEAPKVSAHINQLFKAAEEKVKRGNWITPRMLEISGVDSIKRRIRYAKRVPFELGELFYGPGIAAFVLKNDFADLFENARKRIEGLRYANAKMHDDISRYMPKIKAKFEAVDGSCVMVIEKTADVFLLRDVVEHFGGRLEATHVAWIMNCLLNEACYLSYSKLTHNGLSLDSYFISPQHHSGLMLGGWWYATPIGSKLNALPAIAHAAAGPERLKRREAEISLDLDLIRVIGRAMFGDVTGMTFPTRTDIPKPMAQFLRSPTTGNARRDYELWSKSVLPASFGARRFVPMPIQESDIYR